MIDVIAGLSPILPIADMDRSIQFYTEVLGFDLVMHTDAYSSLSRGVASLHLSLTDDEAALQAAHRHIAFYIEVTDLDSLWQVVMKHRDAYTVREPFDRDYGMREFHIKDPDGCLVFLGQRLK